MKVGFHFLSDRLPQGDFKAGFRAAAMLARYAVEQRKWADAAAFAPRERDLPQALAVHAARDWEDVLDSARDSRTDRAGAGTGWRFIAGGE